MKYILTAFFAMLLIGCGETTTRQIVETVEPGIVLIENDMGNDKGGMGTGFILDDNQIVTNHHVIEDAQKIYVYAKGSRVKYEAKVVYNDNVSDLAVLRLLDWEKFESEVNPTNLTLGDSDKMQEGDKAIVIGHPWGLTWTVAEGIVSAKERRLGNNPKFLDQVDAKLFQGNSGGPIFNDDGEVVCVSNIMITKEGGSYGLCIPSTLIKKVLHDFNTLKEVRWRALNVAVGLTEDGSSVILKTVEPGGAAGMAGLKDGDKVLEIYTPRLHPAGLKITEPNELITEVAKQFGNDEVVKLLIERNGEKMMVEVKTKYRLSNEFETEKKK